MGAVVVFRVISTKRRRLAVANAWRVNFREGWSRLNFIAGCWPVGHLRQVRVERPHRTTRDYIRWRPGAINNPSGHLRERRGFVFYIAGCMRKRCSRRIHISTSLAHGCAGLAFRDWRTVTRNGVPVWHYPPQERDLAERFATGVREEMSHG